VHIPETLGKLSITRGNTNAGFYVNYYTLSHE